MAQRKKKVVRRMAMERVCQRTTKVWSRRLRGTLRGAKRILGGGVDG